MGIVQFVLEPFDPTLLVTGATDQLTVRGLDLAQSETESNRTASATGCNGLIR